MMAGLGIWIDRLMEGISFLLCLPCIFMWMAMHFIDLTCTCYFGENLLIACEPCSVLVLMDLVYEMHFDIHVMSYLFLNYS